MVALNQGLETGTKHRETFRPLSLSNRDRTFLITALGTLVCIRLLLIFWLPVTDTTEARYIEIARKMLVSGDWITPQFDYGVPFWGKPPLHTWLSAIGMKIFGVGHFGARILIFATSIAILFIGFDWAARNIGRDRALVATAIISSSLLFFGASAFVMTDMVMVLGITLCMAGFHTCVCGTGSRRLWGNLFFVGLAIGLMAKGPVAVVLTGIPLFLWLLSGRRWRFLSRLPWATGLALMAALTVPWYLAAEIKTPGFLRYFIIGEHFERFVVPGWSGDLYGSAHTEPKGMIWLYALAAFLPWTVFFAALMANGRQIFDQIRGDDQGWMSYLALWSLSPLILFTPAANILAAYVLPGVPAAAILLTTLWSDIRGRPTTTTRLAVAASLVVFGALYLAVTIAAFSVPDQLTSKSQMTLVEKARETDPDIVLTYWGGRSYSGEFYTQGSARSTTRPEDIAALLTNDRRDAIAVSFAALAEVSTIVGQQFRNLGEFGRRFLLVEIPDDGEQP